MRRILRPSGVSAGPIALLTIRFGVLCLSCYALPWRRRDHEFEIADHDRPCGRIDPWKLRPNAVGRRLAVAFLGLARGDWRAARHLGRLQTLPALRSGQSLACAQIGPAGVSP